MRQLTWGLLSHDFHGDGNDKAKKTKGRNIYGTVNWTDTGTTGLRREETVETFGRTVAMIFRSTYVPVSLDSRWSQYQRQR